MSTIAGMAAASVARDLAKEIAAKDREIERLTSVAAQWQNMAVDRGIENDRKDREIATLRAERDDALAREQRWAEFEARAVVKLSAAKGEIAALREALKWAKLRLNFYGQTGELMRDINAALEMSGGVL
jgi:hypothetical protein